MSFLAPLFLAGAAAIVLPILFHLIRKTTHEKTIFSSLMFLLPTPPKVTRRSRLDQILLLLLRCAVLCLLAVGFARPYLVRPSAAATPRGPGKKVIVLVDTSASMRRENLWPQARERATEVFQALGPADEAGLIGFDDSPKQILAIEEWRRAAIPERRALALARLETLSPSWRGTHLGSALLAAVDALEEVGLAGTPRPTLEVRREIVLITDLQQGSRLDGLQGFEWPKGLTVRVEALKVRRPSNAAIQLVEARDETAAADATRRIRVINSSDSKKEQFKLTWVGATNAPVETYVPPGQSRMLQFPPAISAHGQLALIGDDEDFDNHLYWAGTPQAQINVAYFGSEAENDTARPLFYLKRGFQQTARQSVQITNVTSAPLCFISDTADATQLTNPTIVLVMKSAAAATTISKLLNLPQLSCEEATDQKYSLLGDIDFTHPLFKPFADPRFSDFTKIHFWKHRRLDAQQIPNARVLARFDQGDPALIEVPIAPGEGTRPTGRAGRLLILTSGWHPADSQLALSSKFVPLLYSLLEYSSIQRPLHLQFEVGETLPAEIQNGELKIKNSEGVEIATDKATDAPGIYAAGALPFAVNLGGLESKTAPMAIDELQQLGVPIGASSRAQTISRAREQKFQAAEAENQQKLWRWLILGALAFLLAETFLAGRVTARASATSP